MGLFCGLWGRGVGEAQRLQWAGMAGWAQQENPTDSDPDGAAWQTVPGSVTVTDPGHICRVVHTELAATDGLDSTGPASAGSDNPRET